MVKLKAVEQLYLMRTHDLPAPLEWLANTINHGWGGEAAFTSFLEARGFGYHLGFFATSAVALFFCYFFMLVAKRSFRLRYSQDMRQRATAFVLSPASLWLSAISFGWATGALSQYLFGWHAVGIELVKLGVR